MITCKRATELISKSQDQDLSTTERISLSLHLFLCEFCEQFRKQCELIRRAMRFDPAASTEPANDALSDTDKEKLKSAIRDKLSKKHN